MWFPYVKSTCGHPSTPHTVFPCDVAILPKLLQFLQQIADVTEILMRGTLLALFRDVGTRAFTARVVNTFLFFACLQRVLPLLLLVLFATVFNPNPNVMCRYGSRYRIFYVATA